ncbi:MAG: hypothetical protein IPP40_18255 [bacterium]|nr:hypothetical protein [bacterium]
MRRLSIGLIALILSVLTAMGFTVSVTSQGPRGFAGSVIYTIPTALDTFYVTIANPFNGNYSQGNLDSGGYTFMAFQDGNVNFLPDIDEPRGFYGGDIPTVLQVTEDVSGIDIELAAPNTGGFTGTVTYEGTETGTTLIFAHRTNTFEGLRAGRKCAVQQHLKRDYTAVVDSFGTYYAYAFMDINTNSSLTKASRTTVQDDAEPEPISIVQGEQYPDGIDFELIATPSAAPPVRVASDFRLGHAYPNPFNAATTIPFSLDRQMEIKLTA